MRPFFFATAGILSASATTTPIQPTVSQLTAQGCYQSASFAFGTQWNCRDGRTWIVDSHSQTNAFALFPNTNPDHSFPVVATHGAGAGAVCGVLPDCTSCASANGCVWATGKCISDVSCRGDPYCTESPAMCSSAFDYSSSPFGANPSYIVLEGVEVALPSPATGTFAWPSTTPTAAGGYEGWRPVSSSTASAGVASSLAKPSYTVSPVVSTIGLTGSGSSIPMATSVAAASSSSASSLWGGVSPTVTGAGLPVNSYFVDQSPGSPFSWSTANSLFPQPAAQPVAANTAMFAQPTAQQPVVQPAIQPAAVQPVQPVQWAFGREAVGAPPAPQSPGLSLLSGPKYQYQFGAI